MSRPARSRNNEVEVELKIDCQAKTGDATLFAIELAYAGIFRLTNIPQEAVQPILMIECPRLLFPFARQIIAEASRNGGFPPLLIDPIDFVSLYRQRLAEMQARPRDTARLTPPGSEPEPRLPGEVAERRPPAAVRYGRSPPPRRARRAAPRRRAGMPRAMPKRKPAAKRSPAPVMSTTVSTGVAGTGLDASGVTTRAPSAPMVTAASAAIGAKRRRPPSRSSAVS